MSTQEIIDELERFSTSIANGLFMSLDQKTEVRNILFLKMITCLQHEVPNKDKKDLKIYYENLRKEVLKK